MKKTDEIIAVLAIGIIIGNGLFWLGLKVLGSVIFGLGGMVLLLKLSNGVWDRKHVISEIVNDDDKTVIYSEDDDGQQIPVATIQRHEDCPKDVYEKFWEEIIDAD